MNKLIIHKAAGIIIRDKKLLVEKSFTKEFYFSPGGKIEPGETPVEALIRELHEEFAIVVKAADLTPFGHFSAPIAGQPDQTVEMTVFMVNDWSGEPTASSEVEKIAWIDSNYPPEMKLGSIIVHDLIPELKDADLIN